MRSGRKRDEVDHSPRLYAPRLRCKVGLVVPAAQQGTVQLRQLLPPRKAERGYRKIHRPGHVSFSHPQQEQEQAGVRAEAMAMQRFAVAKHLSRCSCSGRTDEHVLLRAAG